MSAVRKTNAAKWSGLSSPPVSPRRPAIQDETSRSCEGPLAGIQRRRIVAAVADVVCERGLEDTTVADVVRRAGVSRRTFYDLFEDRGDAFLATFEDGVRRAHERVVPAFEGERAWIDRVRAGLTALLCFFDDEPQLARLCVVYSLAAGPVVLERRTEILRAVTKIVDERARGAQKGCGPPPLTGEGVVGGIVAILHARLLEERPGLLVGLVGPLMGMIVLPYAGRAAAMRELARPAYKAVAPADGRSNGKRSARSPLEDLEMRVTYRTLRVLAAIADTPGASNRDIADHAGVKDQGQISKLLTRLERLDLIHNTGTGAPRGEPNAWTLTDKGQEIEAATRAG
jgi:AcrR family transcriptional regulator/DNA-binding MarR family transcriptional regulator